MKRVWIAILCVVMMVILAACGSGGQSAGTAGQKEAGQQESAGEGTDEQTSAEDEGQHQTFRRLGLIYELPEGTEEKKGDNGAYTYTYEDYVVGLVPYNKNTMFNEEFATALMGSANSEEGLSETTVVGRKGYQFTVNGSKADATFAVMEAPQYYVAAMVMKKDSRESDYIDFYKTFLKTIQLDDSVEFVEAKEEKPDYYVDKYTAVTKECTIKITDYKVLQPGEGANAYGRDYVIMFEYDMTNTAGTKMTPAIEWPIIVDVVQDNDPNAVNRLQPAALMDGNTEISLQEIKANGTVHCSTGYTLTDTETPVELTFKNGVVGEELGTMTFKLK